MAGIALRCTVCSGYVIATSISPNPKLSPSCPFCGGTFVNAEEEHKFIMSMWHKVSDELDELEEDVKVALRALRDAQKYLLSEYDLQVGPLDVAVNILREKKGGEDAE